MLRNHIKIAAVLIGIVTAAVIALSVVPQMYKTSVFLAQGSGVVIPSGLPAPMLSSILQSLSSGLESSLGSGLGTLQKLSYIPSKNSVLAGEMNKIYDTITEAETALAANNTTEATNAINYLQQLSGDIITSYAKTSEAGVLKEKLQEDLNVTQEIISAADGWVKSYDGDKSTVQEYLTAAKTGLAASKTNFSVDKFSEAAVHFANTIGSLVELLPVVAPDTAADELNFVYEKASALGLESSKLKAKADLFSNAKKTSGSDAGSVGDKSENISKSKGKIPEAVGSAGGGGSGNKGKDEKVSSKDKEKSTSNKKKKSSTVKKSEKDSSCDNEEKLSSKDKKTSSSKDKKKTSSKDSKKDKSSKVKKTDKDSSCDEEKVSSKDKKKTTSKDKGKSKSKDKKSTSKKKTTDNKK